MTEQEFAPPFARRVGARLRRAVRHEGSHDDLSALEGSSLVVQSVKDPQRAGVRCTRDTIYVENAMSLDSAPTLRVDPITLYPSEQNDSSDSQREPRAGVQAISILLRSAYPPWRELAEDFWSETSARPGTPQRARFVCTDDGSEIALGDGKIREFVLHGSAPALSAYFCGDLVLLFGLVEGSLLMEGTMNDLSVMQGNGLSRILGNDV